MAEVSVLICDWCKVGGRTTLANEVAHIKVAKGPYKLALCSGHVGELLTGAVKATRGGRRAPMAGDLKIG